MKYCTNCGKPIDDDINFCPNCGKKVYKYDPKEEVFGNTNNSNNNEKSKDNPCFILMLVSTILLTLGLSSIGLILYIIALAKDKDKKYTKLNTILLILNVCIFIAQFILGFIHFESSWHYTY